MKESCWTSVKTLQSCYLFWIGGLGFIFSCFEQHQHKSRCGACSTVLSRRGPDLIDSRLLFLLQLFRHPVKERTPRRSNAERGNEPRRPNMSASVMAGQRKPCEDQHRSQELDTHIYQNLNQYISRRNVRRRHELKISHRSQSSSAELTYSWLARAVWRGHTRRLKCCKNQPWLRPYDKVVDLRSD